MMKYQHRILLLLACTGIGVSASAAGGDALAGLGAPAYNIQESTTIQTVPETEGSEAFDNSETTENTVETYNAVTEGLPAIDPNSWEMILANAEHPIGEYEPQTTEIEGMELDYRIIEPMEAFVQAARAEGLPVYLSSGYRDYYTQDYLNQLQQSYGYSKEEADKIVAPAGTSEHQTGLACDITDYYREFKNDELEDTDTYKWMSTHCQEYGFIVRYPKGKDAYTGIIYEPWHFRYVGKEAAEYIMSHNLCLEEFLDLYK